MVRYVVFGKCALDDDVSSGCEGVEQGFGGTCTLSWSDLPEFMDGDGGNGSVFDINGGSQEVCVRNLLQLHWLVVEPFLVEFSDGCGRHDGGGKDAKPVVHISFQEELG